MAEFNKRFRELKKHIRHAIVTEDVFGLSEPEDRKRLREKGLQVLQYRQYQFMTNPQKMRAFQSWLQQRIDEGLLSVDPVSGDPWTSKYIHSSYRQGAMRAYTDSNKAFMLQKPEWYAGSRETFIKMAFAQPEVMSKVELLGTRAFEQLKGMTGTMSQDISRLLSDGLAHGWSTAKIARSMQKSIDHINRARAKRIARTEIINAHAEGQLDSFELLGVDELGVMAEFSTAGDGLVCTQCASLEGQTFNVDKARGIIPVHPNCRCAWIPSEEKVPKKLRR